MIQVWIDGAARPNPGKGGIGVVIRGGNWDYTINKGMSGNKITNNMAEYYALCWALGELKRNQLLDKEITIYSDSEMLVLQMNGKKGVDRGKYLEYYMLASQLANEFGKLTFAWVPRDENAEANLLASRALKL